MKILQIIVLILTICCINCMDDTNENSVCFEFNDVCNVGITKTFNYCCDDITHLCHWDVNGATYYYYDDMFAAECMEYYK